MRFNKEEISLCKQIAEKHRKSLKFGDWYYFKEKVCIIWSKPEPIMSDTCIPLWTISDCLEFLNKKKDITLRICSHSDFNQTTVEHGDVEYYGKTPLEACLKAVLAVEVRK